MVCDVFPAFVLSEVFFREIVLLVGVKIAAVPHIVDGYPGQEGSRMGDVFRPSLGLPWCAAISAAMLAVRRVLSILRASSETATKCLGSP